MVIPNWIQLIFLVMITISELVIIAKFERWEKRRYEKRYLEGF